MNDLIFSSQQNIDINIMSWYVTNDNFLVKNHNCTSDKHKKDLYYLNKDDLWRMIKTGDVNKKAFDAWLEIHCYEPERDE